MRIRKSNLSDLETILGLRDVARQIMRSNGNASQWPDGVPQESKFVSDIQSRYGYIVEEDGVPVATFALIPSPDPTYAVVYEGPGWQCPDAQYGVIHRLASNGRRPGVFAHILAFARQNYSDIRIDTHSDNKIMRHLLAKNGFSSVGTILLANGEPRLAFQWRDTNE